MDILKRKYILTIQNDKLKVTSSQVKSVLAFFTDATLEKSIADTSGMHLSVWPYLEYQQMYKDAWRMLRDYFYDPDLHRVDWEEVFDRYLPLVERCAKREELDDGKRFDLSYVCLNSYSILTMYSVRLKFFGK